MKTLEQRVEELRTHLRYLDYHAGDGVWNSFIAAAIRDAERAAVARTLQEGDPTRARPRLNLDELLALLRDPAVPPPGSQWRHYQDGHLYQVHFCAIDEATAAVRVVYCRVDSSTTVMFDRPLAEWLERVPDPRRPGQTVPRYSRQVD